MSPQTQSVQFEVSHGTKQLTLISVPPRDKGSRRMDLASEAFNCWIDPWIFRLYLISTWKPTYVDWKERVIVRSVQHVTHREAFKRFNDGSRCSAGDIALLDNPQRKQKQIEFISHIIIPYHSVFMNIPYCSAYCTISWFNDPRLRFSRSNSSVGSDSLHEVLTTAALMGHRCAVYVSRNTQRWIWIYCMNKFN